MVVLLWCVVVCHVVSCCVVSCRVFVLWLSLSLFLCDVVCAVVLLLCCCCCLLCGVSGRDRGMCVAVCLVWHAEKPRVYVQNVPVCTGTTRAHDETCARGAGTHGDVWDGHTEGGGRGDVWCCCVLLWHRENSVCPLETYTRARLEWTHRGEGGGHRQFCLPKFAHKGLSRASEVHQK